MQAGHTKSRFPFTPFPRGWFFFELAENIPKGRLVAHQWLGEEVVGWRNDECRICVANAFCPHLGAKLAPEAGGTPKPVVSCVHSTALPYDATGACVAMPVAPPTPPAGCASIRRRRSTVSSSPIATEPAESRIGIRRRATKKAGPNPHARLFPQDPSAGDKRKRHRSQSPVVPARLRRRRPQRPRGKSTVPASRPTSASTVAATFRCCALFARSSRPKCRPGAWGSCSWRRCHAP